MTPTRLLDSFFFYHHCHFHSLLWLPFIIQLHNHRMSLKNWMALYFVHLYLTMSLGTSPVCTHTSWLSKPPTFPSSTSVGSWWNPLELVSVLAATSSVLLDTPAPKQFLVLDKSYPQGRGLQIHWVISLVWIARVTEAPEGQTANRVDTLHLLESFIGNKALVSARVSFDIFELWQRIKLFFFFNFCWLLMCQFWIYPNP